MASNIYPFVLVMALTTYLIRALPLVLIKKEITSRFIKSFLYYVPYVCLAAMTFPAIVYATSSPISAIIGFAVALILAFAERSLITTAVLSCAAVFMAERIIELI